MTEKVSWMNETEHQKHIDERLVKLRLSNSVDPKVYPKWSFTTYLFYFLHSLEYPIIILMEITYFCIALYAFITFKKSMNKQRQLQQAMPSVHDIRSNYNKNRNKSKLSTISIIIPCYNESDSIEQTLLCLEKNCINPNNVEIILIDGNSTDKWQLKVQKLIKSNLLTISTRIIDYNIHNKSGRGQCQKIGAEKYARNDIFMFVHADVLLSYGYDKVAIEALNNLNVVCGSLLFALDRGTMTAGLAGMELLEWRTRRMQYYMMFTYGDCGIFVDKCMYDKIGGVPDQCLMEDYEFMSKARKYAMLHDGMIYSEFKKNKPCIAWTSARKLIKSKRIWITSIRNQRIVFLYTVYNYTPKKLYKLYYGKEFIDKKQL